jgi:hypothetical protein
MDSSQLELKLVEAKTYKDKFLYRIVDEIERAMAGGRFDMEVAIDQISPLVHRYHYDIKHLGLVALELIELYVGEEKLTTFLREMKRSIYFKLGPSITHGTVGIMYSEYFSKLGLTREMYLTNDSIYGYPLHYLFCSACIYDEMDRIKLIPSDIIEEGLLLQDEYGNTPLHLSSNGICEDFFGDASTITVSFLEILEHLCTIPSYEKALLITNCKGESPLHTIIKECNCSRTVLKLLETPVCRYIANTCKDSEGNTPLQLFNKYKECYKGDTTKLEDAFEEASKDMVKAARS